MKPVLFFDIGLDRFTPRSLELRLQEILAENHQTLIATPNPEMLLAASEDESLQSVLQRMHIRIPDGIGLTFLARLTGQGNLRRYPGVDVLLDICRLAAVNQQHVLLLGGWGKDAKKAADILEAAFPGLRVTALGDMQIRYEDGEWEQPEEVLEAIHEAQPDVLAVALGGGAYDRQERWIVDHAPQFASVKLAIGVGGAVDMISGRVKRAPKWLQAIGLEWLWRLVRQPKRLGRILNATVRFPIRAISDRLHPTQR